VIALNSQRSKILLTHLSITAAICLFVIVPHWAAGASYGGAAASSDTSWLVGKWKLTFDPDGGETEWFVFGPDGHVSLRGEKGLNIEGSYRPAGSNTLKIIFQVSGKTIPLDLAVSADRARLINDSGAYYTRENDDAFKAKMAQVIRNHPDLVLNILRENRLALYEIVQEGAKVKTAQMENVRIARNLKNPYKPNISDERISLGSKNAPITIVGYSNFLSHYCGSASRTIAELMERHPDKIQYVFKHLPNSDLSRELAVIFEAVGRRSREKALEFHELVFEMHDEIVENKEKGLKAVFDLLDIDRSEIFGKLHDRELAGTIRGDLKEAKAFQLMGAPAFLINGVALFGAVSVEKFENVIVLVEKNEKRNPQ